MARTLIGERLTISGHAADLSFSVRAGTPSADLQGPAAIQIALADQELIAELQPKLERHVKKAFGKEYEVDPLSMDVARSTIGVTVTTIYDEVQGHNRLPKAAGEAVERIRRDILALLEERAPASRPSVRGDWEAGGGVSDNEFVLLPETPERDLHGGLLRARRARDRLRTRSNQFLWLGVAVLVVGAGAGVASMLWAVGAYVAAYGLVFLCAGLILNGQRPQAENRVAEIENELDLRALPSGGEAEKRAQKLFKVHSYELKRYYDQALRQAKYIFYVGVVCIALGFGVIVATLVLITKTSTLDLDDKVIVAALGAIGGISTNFIGVIYLGMFKETLASLTEFHQRLVVTHHLHFGNFLAAKISDAGMRNQTLAAMAAALSGRPDDISAVHAAGRSDNGDAVQPPV